jgi:TonB family protein
MTFQRSISISMFIHLLFFGGALAYARYQQVMVGSSSHEIRVAFVSSDVLATGTATGTKRQKSSHIEAMPHREYTFSVHGPDKIHPDTPERMNVSGNEAVGDQKKTGVERRDAQGISVTSYDNAGDVAARTGFVSEEQWSVIGSAIERNKKYPRIARERGIEGIVRLRFRVDQTGSVQKIEVVESSGSEILDSASIRAVERAAPMPYVNGWIEVPIAYVLTR